MATANVIDGTNLCLFITSGATKKCIALATNCKISMNMATKQISSKDSTGNWEDYLAGRLSWTIDSDNLFTQDTLFPSGFTYDNLVEIMINRTTLTATIGQVSTPLMGYPQALGSTYNNLSGSCYVTKIDLNAPNDDSATFTVSLQGTGALTHSTT